MIKIKQTRNILASLCLLASIFVGALSLGISTANAYTCGDPANPSDVYEYHESDGMCWKVRYTNRQQDPPVANCTGGTCACPNSQPFVLNGQCKQVCTSGDSYHADDNSCWYKNGYTGNGGQVQPTNNDGTAIAANNSTCTDGFVYLKDGNGNGGPGCYDKAPDGTFPCAADQDVNTRGGARGVTTQDCGDAVKQHLVPKDKAQTADKTKINDNSACTKQYSGADQKDQLAACQAAANNPTQDCNKQPNQDMKDACNAGKKASAKPSNRTGEGDNTGNNCGEAETILIHCEGQGVQAIGDVLKIAVSVLSVIVGIAAVGGLAWSAILYAKAEDNSSNVSEARTWIRNIVIGILVYGFMVAIVNWLVPGGVINT